MEGFSSSSDHTRVEVNYRSFQFGTMEGIQLVDTVGTKRVSSKSKKFVSNSQLCCLEGVGWVHDLCNIS